MVYKDTVKLSTHSNVYIYICMCVYIYIRMGTYTYILSVSVILPHKRPLHTQNMLQFNHYTEFTKTVEQRLQLN